MNEILIKNEETGELFPDRRSNTTMEIQQVLFKISAKMDALEEKVDLKMTTMEEKIDVKFGALSELLKEKVVAIEKKVEVHCDDVSIDETLKEHDDKIKNAEQYVDRIHKLEDRMERLEQQVEVLKNLPKNVAWETIKYIGKKIGIILLSVIGVALVLGIISPKFIETLSKLLLP